ncbi:MAG: MurR/RpiR family transcriptional regulator [Alphaproteobacteria bacterium]|nr:MAG: MurR/RpiR family transcriptional regulator [Alphaproteobacteria bacterium]
MAAMNDTVREVIRAREAALTRAERQIAAAILADYPVSALGPITRLAEAASVSTPTVARLVQKLGYKGFAEFQSALREELAAQISSPIAKHERWAGEAPAGHALNRFTESVIGNIRQTLAHIDPASFDRTAALLADTGRQVFVAGGRITHVLAEYLYLHLQVIRPGVRHISAMSSVWPHAVLDMNRGDVLVIYDMRRYQNAVLKLAEIAEARGLVIVLVTDQWRSPVSRHAAETFACRIEVPSAWDSTAVLLLLSETLIAAVQESAWQLTRARMSELEAVFDDTRIFRKFV